MINFVKKILGGQYHFLNQIEISRTNIVHNYRYLSKINPKIKIAPVLKSNAYGHGLVEVARVLDRVGAPFFCVDSLHEAYQLYKAKIKTPILIMGYIDPENLKVKRLPFSYAVFDLEMLKVLNKFQPQAGVHIFVDTGMNREGIKLSELPQFLYQVKQLNNLKIEGLMSHLATSLNPIFSKQKVNFQEAQEIFKKILFKPKWVHLAASDGLINQSDQLQNTNLARMGLSLYGIASDQNLKPVLTFKTILIQIKKIRKGEFVGYDRTFKAPKNMTIGILPVGYNDGVERRRSNKGFTKIGEQFAPIIGKVSMNVTTIDITNITNLAIGQSVTVYSSTPGDKNSIANSAKIAQTIPYELLIHLASSTKREVV